MNVWEVLYQSENKMQKWKCKVLLQWGKDFHYFIILYLSHLWTLDGQPLEISLPLKSQGLFPGYPWIYLAPRNIKTLERTRECTAGPGPEIIQVLEKNRDCTAGRSWNFPGGIFFVFWSATDWPIWSEYWRRKSFWMGFCNKILENW